jgi:hypothetical protein
MSSFSRLSLLERWSPLKLGPALLAWWASDRPELISLSSSKVTSWRDVVGGYDVAQATDGARPLWSATSFNGRPGVTFDGTDDFLETATSPLPTNAALTYHMFGLAQQDGLVADAVTRFLICSGGTNARRGIGRIVSGGANRGFSSQGSGAGNTPAIDTVVALDGRHVITGRFGPADTGVAVDSQAETVAAVLGSYNTSRLRIGANTITTATQFWKGAVSDIVCAVGLTPEQVFRTTAWLLERRAAP